MNEYRVGFMHGVLIVLTALLLTELYFANTARTPLTTVEPETLTPEPETKTPAPKKKTTRKRPSTRSG